MKHGSLRGGGSMISEDEFTDGSNIFNTKGNSSPESEQIYKRK